MESGKVGWSVFLFGIVLGITHYYGLLGNQTYPFTQWILTPVSWASIVLFIIGALMIKFGRGKSQMPRYQSR